MKKLFYLLLPLLAAGWLASLGGCRVIDDSENKTKPPAGLVLEYGTEKPISGARVSLQEYEGELLGAHSFTEVDNTLTDNDGAYNFKTTGFLVTATKDGYFTDDQTGKPILNGSEKRMDIHLYPHAWLKVYIKNDSGAYEFYYQKDDGLVSKFSLLQGEKAEFNEFLRGNNNKLLIYGALDSSGNLLFSKVDSVYLKGHDTTSITITY